MFSERMTRGTAPEVMAPHEKLKEAGAAWAKYNNELFKKFLPDAKLAGNILDDNCRVDMRAFTVGRGGPLKKESSKEHEKQVQNKEASFSGAYDAAVQKRYGTDNQEAIIAQWRRENEKRDGALAETVVLAVLNKFLNERFVVVRASSYDDYEHGVDTLILDRESGGVVCAVDEVVGILGDDRYADKVSRAQKRLKEHGGMQVTYGLTFEKTEAGTPELRRGTLPNVPGFCISLEKEELHTLIRECDFTPQSDITDGEKKLFERIIAALERQKQGAGTQMSPLQHSHIEALLTFAQSRLDT